MDENPSVKLSLTGKITYNEDITLTQAGQIIAFIDSTSGQSGSGNTQIIAQPVAQGSPSLIQTTNRPTSPRDILESSGAKTNPEKIVAFAKLVLSEGVKDTFTIDDIKPMFRRARESTPANLSRDLDAAFKSGWIDEADTKGEYYLTQEAYDAVDNGFESLKKKTSGSPRSNGRMKSKTRKPVEVPEVFKEVDPIPQALTDVPVKYSALKVVGDCFLWVLALAKSLDLDGLTNKEIVWVTDHLGAGIPTNNINSNYTGAQKKGYVNKSTQTGNIRITEDGLSYLKTLTAG